MSPGIVWTDELEPSAAVELAGSKMGRLAELARAGVTVPPGFTVTVDAYRRHCASSRLDEHIDEILDGLSPDAGQSDLEAASMKIAEAFTSRDMPAELAEAITEAYGELCLHCLDVNVPTAVRSSATGEDAGDASFAGIFETYLGVSGVESVLAAVRDCWASLHTPRALSYRLARGISHHDMPIAVGVIELIHARASGVAFSVHPVSGKRDRIVIESNWGWGEAVVQGLVSPDHAELGKADLRLLDYRTAHKAVVSAFDYSAGRVVETEMPAGFAERPVLDEEQVTAIGAAVIAIEEHYAYPVDVEWVISRDRRAGEPVCITQSRPVTVGAADEPAQPGWDPAAMAAKYVFRTS
jgi:pyruvate,water dikinase